MRKEAPRVGRRLAFIWTSLAVLLAGCGGPDGGTSQPAAGEPIDDRLSAVLHEQGFTGRVEESLERRLGRKLDPKLADVGRLLFFDRISNLHNDNTCAGCHTPTNGFGDSQPMAIGIQSNLLVGPHRLGPRNQRRTPTVVNAAFYPRLMWNGRFAAFVG